MPKNELDKTDLEILKNLQDDGRLTNVELANKIALSPSPCLRRVKQLEESGVISGYQASLDRKAVGLGMTVFVEMRVVKQDRTRVLRILEELTTQAEVVSCHLVSGQSDILAEVVVPSLEAYDAFLSGFLMTIEGVEDVRSNFAIRTLKANGPLPLQHLEEQLS
ncbi:MULTISPECIES: Lrp/AsnC family transcriptional regulator [Pseudovibrio]|uniref:Lrp/AsnC family transcriptional regulator n=1 Tax=Stappiaceae TaxID=2821832 RepID=UPI00236653AF|nr:MULTISPECIES: Lrp/AsnC family transcriptional regulator [Pseudovibrio]MDD7911910.1 Lrp/AsnC family transcriptional regulator [Pseudovibrio exalbescens]MDX5595424.1 Lrp/AsnC family transcriptional regulator [Pseudovibrio sp. SPO723]